MDITDITVESLNDWLDFMVSTDLGAQQLMELHGDSIAEYIEEKTNG